jgi:hypothetical protein
MTLVNEAVVAVAVVVALFTSTLNNLPPRNCGGGLGVPIL